MDRLPQREAEKLIGQAYREGGQRGLLVKTLLLSGARVSKFVAIRAEDLSLDEAVLRIRPGKGRKKRNVPILPGLAQELSTHLVGRTAGYLFESRGPQHATLRAASSKSFAKLPLMPASPRAFTRTCCLTL